MSNNANNPELIPGNIPPQAPEIEAAILEAIISTGGNVFDNVMFLKSEMFFDPTHAAIFSVLQELHRKNKKIDLITTVQAVRDSGKIETIPISVIASLRAGDISQIEKYGQIVAEKHAARHCLRRLNEITASVYSNMPIDEISDDLGRLDWEINGVLSDGDQGADIVEVMKSTLSNIEKRIINYRNGVYPGVTTGLKKLDKKIGGFQPGTLTIVAGRPGTGKTSLALHFAEMAARADFEVLFFSYEMTAAQVGDIILARSGSIRRVDIRDGRLTEDELQQIHQSAGTVEKLKIQIYDNPSITTGMIEATVKRHVRRHGVNTMLLVDYLQLIPPTDRKVTREQQVGEMSRHLKKISIGLKIPVICMAQLNRDAKDAEPELWHLRESGSIEQDADTVLLIYRLFSEGFTDAESVPDADKLIGMKIAKNRHGEPGKINIYHDGQYTAFGEEPGTDVYRRYEGEAYTHTQPF